MLMKRAKMSNADLLTVTGAANEQRDEEMFIAEREETEHRNPFGQPQAAAAAAAAARKAEKERNQTDKVDTGESLPLSCVRLSCVRIAWCAHMRA
jgi:hypothetical protein